MNKSIKTSILRHWFGVDRILLGGPSSAKLSEEAREKYITSKGAMLSNLYEIYRKINFSTGETYSTKKELVEASIEKATKCILKSKQVLVNESVSKMVKEEIAKMGSVEGLNEEQVAKYVVSKRHCAIALDGMLFEFEDLNKTQKDALSSWDGKTIVEAHKTMRDNLIDISMS